MDLIREFVQKKHATIGFSLLEALHAARVTVVGGEGAFSEEALNALRIQVALWSDLTIVVWNLHRIYQEKFTRLTITKVNGRKAMNPNVEEADLKFNSRKSTDLYLR